MRMVLVTMNHTVCASLGSRNNGGKQETVGNKPTELSMEFDTNNIVRMSFDSVSGRYNLLMPEVLLYSRSLCSKRYIKT